MKENEKVVRAIVAVCVIAAIAALGAGPSPSAAGDSDATTPAVNNDFATAMALFRAGDIDAALPRFEQAAHDEPNVLDHQLALATVYLRKQRGPEGWTHLRKAVRINPKHPQAAAMFLDIWRRFDARGVLNTSHPIDGVTKILGAPDRQQQGAPGSGIARLEYGFMAIDFVDGRLYTTLDLRGLTRAALRPDRSLAPAFDQRKWRLGHRSVSSSSVISEFVLPGQSVQRYDELCSVRRHPELAERGVSCDAFVANIRRNLEKNVRGAVFNVIRRAPGEVVYEFIVPADSNQPAQHEVARVLTGPRDIHAVAYVKMGPAMNEDLRDAWIKRLDRATLTKTKIAAAGE